MSPHRLLVWIVSLLAVAAAGSARAQTSPFVSGAWCGNVSASSATVSIRLNAPGLRVRLALSTNESLSPVKFFDDLTTFAESGNTVALDAAGLAPNTDYFFGFEVAGILRTEVISRGRFHTFPAGPASFRIAFGGDSDYTHADQRAFDAIIAERPLLFIHLGDLHYNDTNTKNPDDYRANYDRVLNQPNEGALFRSMGTAYMWDDHDSMGNDSDGTFAGVATARAVYAERVPHYPIAPSAGGAIAQSFTVGRVRVIMTDTRSASVPGILPESPDKSRLGLPQRAWFKQELLSARDAGFPLILWVQPDPWIDPPALGSDTWASWATVRTELANFIRDNRIKNIVMLSADMHALAYDDGTHSDYATGGGAPLIVLHAAALARDGSVKGGPYTAGPFPGSVQYGILDITDTGGSTVQCRFTGKKVGEGAKLTFAFSASAGAIDTNISPGTTGPVDRALINISARSRVASPGETVIAGFVIAGKSSRSILLRAAGPSLAAFVLTDMLTQAGFVHFRNSTVVASNNDWGLADPARLTQAFDRAGAFRFLSNTSHDAALLLTLPPGAYTIQAGSTNGGTGSIVVEVYEVP